MLIKNVSSNCLDFACSHGNIDIFQYLIEEKHINVNKYLIRQDGKDLINSSLTIINENTDALLNIILSEEL